MKTFANCSTCGTHLVGEKLNRIGDNFYCQSDYEKRMEVPDNIEAKKRDKMWKRLLTPYSGLLSYDFTDGDWTNALYPGAAGTFAERTITITVEGSNAGALDVVGNKTGGYSSLSSYTTAMAYGNPYKIKVRSTKTGTLEVVYLNSNTSGDSYQVVRNGEVFTSIGPKFHILLIAEGAVTFQELNLVEA